MAKNRITVFSAPEKGKNPSGESFFAVLDKYKDEKNQFGGNKHYGKEVLLSLHGRQREDARHSRR